MIRKQSSFIDSPGVVELTKKPLFFFGEPGAGVILLGYLVEPDKLKNLIIWTVSLGAAVTMPLSKSRPIQLLSLPLAAVAAYPFGDSKYIKFIFGMSTTMRILRIFEILLHPEYFQARGTHYTLKFVFLYVGFRVMQDLHLRSKD